MKKKENFPQNKLVDFFTGGRIQGDVCVGDCWEIKDQIGEKKFSGGPEIFGGDFLGKCQKGVEKLFGGSKKWCEFFGGSQQFLGGEFFGKKKKSPGRFSGKILNFSGDFLGGSYTGGRVWGECWEIKDKILEKNFRGPEILGGGTFGENAKKGWKHFFGGVLGEL